MNPIALVLLIVTAIGVGSLPRKWVSLPLLIDACYMTNAQAISLGPFHFTVLRIVLLIGFIRASSRGERLVGGLKAMDKIILVWGFWLLCSSFFHRPFGESLVFRLGVAYNVIGIYFLMRKFCRTPEDVVQIIKILALVLLPVGIEMVNEKITHKNIFGFLGGVPIDVVERDDKFRAQGPFGHPILAGTVGGLCIAYMFGIWKAHPLLAKIGIAACVCMVLASTSSGPIMTVLFAVFALLLWYRRSLIGPMRVGAIIVYFVCNLIMTRPAYYLLEKIDLTGSSAGYHRAAVIEAGLTHLNEWWLAGTDYTRHWLPYGVSWSPNHVDITNHYLFYGVDGGLPSMFLLIAMVSLGFRYMRNILRRLSGKSKNEQFLIWTVGAGLFAHATTMISVAYFDQSVIFLYLNVAIITSLEEYSSHPTENPVVEAVKIPKNQNGYGRRTPTGFRGGPRPNFGL